MNPSPDSARIRYSERQRQRLEKRFGRSWRWIRAGSSSSWVCGEGCDSRKGRGLQRVAASLTIYWQPRISVHNEILTNFMNHFGSFDSESWPIMARMCQCHWGRWGDQQLPSDLQRYWWYKPQNRYAWGSKGGYSSGRDEFDARPGWIFWKSCALLGCEISY